MLEAWFSSKLVEPASAISARIYLVGFCGSQTNGKDPRGPCLAFSAVHEPSSGSDAFSALGQREFLLLGPVMAVAVPECAIVTTVGRPVASIGSDRSGASLPPPRWRPSTSTVSPGERKNMSTEQVSTNNGAATHF